MSASTTPLLLAGVASPVDAKSRGARRMWRGALLLVSLVSMAAAVALLSQGEGARRHSALVGELDSGRGVDTASSRRALVAFYDDKSREDRTEHVEKRQWERYSHSAFHLSFDGVRRGHAAAKDVIARIFPGARGRGHSETLRLKTEMKDPEFWGDGVTPPPSFDDEVTNRISHKNKVKIDMYMESLCPGCRYAPRPLKNASSPSHPPTSTEVVQHLAEHE